MVTNQPDYLRKKYKKKYSNNQSILKKKLYLDDIYVCYSDDDHCYNRKPNPGMIYDAQKK